MDKYHHTLISWLFLLATLVISSQAIASSKLNCTPKTILGKVEKVLVEDKMLVNAKLDTGADMSSLSATNLSIMRRNNKRWVLFYLLNPTTHQKIVMTKPLLGFITFRKRRDEVESHSFIQYGQPRPIVQLKITLNKKSYLIKTNLVDRSHFQYPLLLGAETIKQLNAVVDVTQHHLSLFTSPA